MHTYRKNDTLTEVRKGETGTGLLIEHDGHILGNSDLVQQLREDVARHSELVIPDRFKVSAVFQKYGIKNANGRVYPEGILKREVEKYIETRVRNRSAVGALDHPECQLAGTKILTEHGWKNIEAVCEGERIITLTEDKNIEVKPVDRKIEANYSGRMIRLRMDGAIDLTVTPNHRFPMFGADGQFNGFHAAEMIAKGFADGLSLMKTRALSVGADECFAFYAHEGFVCADDLEFEEVEYNGKVYCVEVANHDFYTMDLDGNCIWSGNSTTLSGHDVSHVITELHWVGKTLVGEMELHLSPGFRRYGICSTTGDLAANMILDGIQIGVSSRGVGSVEERLGVLEVGDDFELIGWDIVLEPSTPNAYIARNMEDLTQFIESSEAREGKPTVNERLERVKEILS